MTALYFAERMRSMRAHPFITPAVDMHSLFLQAKKKKKKKLSRSFCVKEKSEGHLVLLKIKKIKAQKQNCALTDIFTF